MKVIRLTFYLFACLFWQVLSLSNNDGIIPDFLSGSLHTQNSMIRSLSSEGKFVDFFTCSFEIYFYNFLIIIVQLHWVVSSNNTTTAASNMKTDSYSCSIIPDPIATDP